MGCRVMAASSDSGIASLREEFMVTRLNDTQDRLQDKDDEIRKRVISWLSTSDPSTNHADQRRKHQASTGDWFVKSTDMEQWRRGSNSFLWLHGTCESDCLEVMMPLILFKRDAGKRS